MAEEWRDVVKSNGKYQVSSWGRVRSYAGKLPSGSLLKLYLNKYGYLAIGLCLPNFGLRVFLVHRLVAEAFIGPCPEGYEVNHKDMNKANASVENLEYVTPKANVDHAYQGGKWKHRMKLSDEDVRTIRKILSKKNAVVTMSALARQYKVLRGLIGNIHHKRARTRLLQ